ncbi:LacI family DNA-binding transcriptional regulator [Opacimonas viscosa]|uniref:LacI family DNA-binding transcriptional regulator n=1 Tax=Opacimonas viscosa TaxID=2961944 RepID=A0AA41X153_9ALTE|nr:LacI family DNA-binding transcriptional regulator [Opacimonas viscosa]MCP3427573.1 LacI family DNA-binding transcriptional regulator [Opacimonas viscosa]
MATIKDVARVAGVSIATVSRVVNKGPKVGQRTRDKVLSVMNELGYTPNANARALVTQKSTTIGLVIPDLSDPFFAALASGVDKIAKDSNVQLLISTSSMSAESEKQAIDLLVERRCEAIIIHSKLLAETTLIELSQRIPGLILIDRFIESINDRCVWLDNLEGGRIAARHFASLGHKQIACINSNYSIDDPKLRLEGFRLALVEQALKLENDMVSENEPSLKGGEIATQKLLASGKPFSALFAYNDAMAIGAISTLEDNGFKVPQDVSVIGFDDVILSRYSRPKLTTLHYPIEEMAQNAAKLALSFAANEQADVVRNYLPRLIKRESTA